MARGGCEMKNQSNNLYMQLLLSFFRLVGAKSELRIFSVSIVDKLTNNAKAVGSVLWDDDSIDDEPQGFVWYIPVDNQYIHDSTMLINCLIENEFIQGDKISISEDELKKILLNKSWEQKTIREALEYLLDLDIRMVDNGEETSSFFVHF